MKKKNYLKATTIKSKKGLVAIASTETPDRVGDSLKATDWDLAKFKANPVLQAGHDYNPQFTIGIAKNIRVNEKKQLVFEPVFHEITQLARDIKGMYQEGILKAWSVGFIPYALMKNENGEKMGKNELLEVSAVAVPANSEALTYAKSYGDSEIKNINDWVEKALPSDDSLIDDEDGIEVDIPQRTPDDELVEGEKCVTEEGKEGVAVMEEEKLVCRVLEEETEEVEDTQEEKKKGIESEEETKEEVIEPEEPEEETEEEVVEPEEEPEEPEEVEEVEEEVEDIDNGANGKAEPSIGKGVDEPVEKKEASDTVSDELREVEERKQKWDKIDKLDSIIYAFYNVYMDKDTPVADFDKLLTEVIKLLNNLLEGSENKGYVSDLLKSDNCGLIDIINLSVNEGKVFSGINQKRLAECTSDLKKASAALDSLLSASEQVEKSQENAGKVEDIKGREKVKVLVDSPVSKKRDADKIVLRALQKISALSAGALYEKKKK